MASIPRCALLGIGTVLGGVSAGSICWHVGGPTDSFGKDLAPVTDALAFLPYGNGVHYDSEEQRRPLLHELVRTGVLPMSYATDDRVAIVYRGTEPVEVVTDLPDSDASAYRVRVDGDTVVEERLLQGPDTLAHCLTRSRSICGVTPQFAP